MHILIISQWYAPEPDGRVSALAEGLVKNGHEVTVITGFPNYPKGALYDGYTLKWRQWESSKGVRILRLPLYPDHSRSVIKRSLNYLSFSLSLTFMAPWFISKPDVIWSYTALVGLPTVWISRLFRAPFVMEIADIWPDTLTATGMLKEGLFVRALGRVSKYIYNSAAALTVQNPGFKPCIEKKGVKPEKIHVIENWADENIYQPTEYDEELAKACGMYGRFNVVFAGALGMAQGLDTIIEAARLCADAPEIQFVFIGDGSCLTQTKEYVQQNKLKNVIFLGRKPAIEMPRYFAISDVLLVHLHDEPIFEITLPAKTQAYLACGKPVIMAKRGDGAALIDECACGISCLPDNPEAMAQSVKALLEMSVDRREAMGKAGRALYLQRFTKAGLLRKMESVIVNVGKEVSR